MGAGLFFYIADILDAYVNSDFGDYDKASQIDLGNVLATSGSTLMKMSIESNEDAIKMLNDITSIKIKLLKSEKGREQLEFAMPSSKRKEKKLLLKWMATGSLKA